MPIYVYRARDKAGSLESGTIETINEDTAAEVLLKRDLVLTKIIVKEKIFNFEKLIKGGSRVSLEMIMVFTKQFSTMVNAGMSIVESLKTLADEEANPYFSEVVKNIARSVEGGSNLSDSMGKYPKIFSKVYINMIRVGEASGKLDIVLLKNAEQLEKEYDLKTKIKGAMIYPAFILVSLVAIAVLMVVYVVPKLRPILETTGVKLPFLTNVMIFASDALIGYWWIIVPIIIAISFFPSYYIKRTRKGNIFWDTLKIKLPVSGKITKNIYMARLTRTFSTLIAGGVNIIEALEITADSIGNINYRKDLLNISKDVKDGVSLADSFKRSQHSSKIVKKMMKVGESTGTLDTTIEKLALFFEVEVENSVSNLSKTLEPILIVIMGVGVALVVSSVIMPLYDATTALK